MLHNTSYTSTYSYNSTYNVIIVPACHLGQKIVYKTKVSQYTHLHTHASHIILHFYIQQHFHTILSWFKNIFHQVRSLYPLVKSETSQFKILFQAPVWQVRVFGPSGIVDIPSERLYICPYVLLICVGEYKYASIVPPFLMKHDCQFCRTPVGARMTWRVIPLWKPPPGTTRDLNILDNWTSWGVP